MIVITMLKNKKTLRIKNGNKIMIFKLDREEQEAAGVESDSNLSKDKKIN